jgi:hypothetical protein
LHCAPLGSFGFFAGFFRVNTQCGIAKDFVRCKVYLYATMYQSARYKCIFLFLRLANRSFAAILQERSRIASFHAFVSCRDVDRRKNPATSKSASAG